jgi:hypothetical protein
MNSLNLEPHIHEDSFQNLGAGMPETSLITSLTGHKEVVNDK